MMPRLLPLAALVAALVSAPAFAERYRVDLIVFADKTGAGTESALAVQVPNLKGALEPTDTAALRAAGIEMLPEDQFGLNDAWNHLRNSRNHQPLLRYAWIQNDPPADRTVSLHIRYGSPFAALDAAGSSAVYPLDGSVALLVTRYLHFDADLVWTETAGAGELGSYRLHERRRMRRDEIHHLDSPKLGLLARVQKAEAPKAETKTAPKAAPSRKPAKRK